MARWRLTHPHYLNCIGKDRSEWEFKERNRKTQQVMRKRFNVPRFLHPDTEADWNYRMPGDPTEGYIVVAHDNDHALPEDYLFVGDPTPDMTPLDDEAKVLTASFAEAWNAPQILDDDRSFGENLAANLMTQFQEAQVQTQAPSAGMQELLAAMTAMMKQQGELIAALAKPAIERRA